jgi:poly(3-hydroxybutyrate) depolymerase
MFFMPPTEPGADRGAGEAPPMTEVNEHYSLFVPLGIAQAGAPLVAMLHGALQDTRGQRSFDRSGSHAGRRPG